MAALESAVHNELVLYRSEAVDGTPIGVSGIVALHRDAPPEQGYPVVSWAHGAARQLYPQISDRPAIVGHSQGGQAALFTPLMLTGAIVGSRAGATADGKVIDPAQVLTDQALALFENSGCKCRVELSESDSWGGIQGTDPDRPCPT